MMPAGRRRAAVAVALVAVAAALAAAGWWFDARTRPARVGPRFVEALTERHPGTTVAVLDGGMLRASLESGTRIDVRLSSLFDDCAAHRFACSDAIDRALADVDAVAALARTPRKDALQPVVLGEGAGYRYGYVTEPLVGALELRYALVAGNAWTYATGAIVDRLGLSHDALKAAALADLRAEPQPRLEKLDEAGTTIWRVRSAGDPAASLVDEERMTRFAGEVGARRLYVVAPTRGTLAIGPADAASAAALDALRARLRGAHPTTPDSSLMRYDVDAPSGQRLTVAGAAP